MEYPRALRVGIVDLHSVRVELEVLKELVAWTYVLPLKLLNRMH